MYNEYFGLTESPFSIAPNPEFLFMSERHREALAHLLYGIRSDGGFILLTGEVGTGKTTVCRCLLAQIPEDVDTAFVLNPKQTAPELLASICDEFRIPCPEDASIKVLVDRINDYLLTSHRDDRRTVLIIDEAQNLSTDVLEQLRLLTNLETNQRKLLQIILLGQPELLELLDRKELRQLAQRVTARFHLDALSREETAGYIGHRLEVAGCRQPLFAPAAVARIFALSEGVPRLINLICDRALLGAYAQDQRQVDRKIVDRAAAEIFGQRPIAPARTRSALVSAAAALLVVLGVAGGYFAGRHPAAAAHDRRIDVPVPPVTRVSVGAPKPRPTTIAAGKPKPAPETPVTVSSEPVITATAQPTTPPETDALINVQGDDSAETAMTHLFTLWGEPLPDAGTPACQQARQLGLSCMMALGSLRDLTQLNRPAVINLSIAGIDNFLAVTRVQGGVIKLVSNKGVFRLKSSDLIRSWDGHFAILWKPPPGYRIVKQGDKGAMVDWLYRELAVADGDKVKSVSGKTFGPTLEDRLKRFQITQGLKPDGIAGAYTWIHINSMVDKDVPRLSSAAGG